jgi:L-fuconolactonase
MIDAHQHFWQIGCNDCTWPTPELAPIYRDCGPAELSAHLKAAGITATVLVQSQASDRDTDYLCNLTLHTPWVAALVGWADLESPAAPARIATLARRPKVRGLRPMLQDFADDRILAPAMVPAIDSMLAHDLCFDALIRPHHLPHLRIFAARHPHLRIVIDHAAKPDIARNQLEPWREHLRALGQLPNVFCKLSGLVTEAGANWQIADLVPYVAHVLDCFGPRRVMWGSDWPVVELASEYSRWLQAAQALTAHLTPDDAAAVFGDTAVRFYRL